MTWEKERKKKKPRINHYACKNGVKKRRDTLSAMKMRRCYDRTKTLLSLFSALLSAAVLFLANLSGARSRGNLDAVLGLRLPERLLLWFSLF
jgi:hypothetical protein